jgi:hypothetical protein
MFCLRDANLYKNNENFLKFLCVVFTMFDLGSTYKKVKLSLYRPRRPLGLREFQAPTFSDILLIDGAKVVSPNRRLLFYPQEDSWYSFLLEAESTPGL